jgi:hypothetical protein
MRPDRLADLCDAAPTTHNPCCWALSGMQLCECYLSSCCEWYPGLDARVHCWRELHGQKRWDRRRRFRGVKLPTLSRSYQQPLASKCVLRCVFCTVYRAMLA